ncbi:Uma2 family endonuclease [Kineococcus sp. R86509]|uniref:Uma2 family endonuclease n=1 Tax=Kineococcus sp. R86509 TaxID=3093851 RepID=UPI0036D2148F
MSATTIVAHGGVLDDWLQHRRALGLDTRDEIWNGTYHVTPHAHASHGRLAARLIVGLHAAASAVGLVALTEFNLGVEDDFRVPDLGFLPAAEEDGLGLYVPSAAIVVEIISPDDASYAKIPFYLARGVKEVWLLDPTARTLSIHSPTTATTSSTLSSQRGDASNTPQRSTVLGIDASEVTAQLGW